MSLPLSVVHTETVQLSGGEAKVRSLTITEVRRIRAIKDSTRADVLAIALAVDMSEDDALAWFEQATAGDLARLLDGIFRASGLDDGAGFPGTANDDAGAERPNP